MTSTEPAVARGAIGKFYYQGSAPSSIPVRNLSIPVAFPQGTTLSTVFQKSIKLGDGTQLPTMWSPYANHLDGSIAWASADVRIPTTLLQTLRSSEILIEDRQSSADLPAIHPQILTSMFSGSIWMAAKTTNGQPSVVQIQPVVAPGSTVYASHSYIKITTILSLGQIGVACFWKFSHAEPWVKLTITLLNGWDYYNQAPGTASTAFDQIQLGVSGFETFIKRSTLHGFFETGSSLIPGAQKTYSLFPTGKKLGFGQGTSFDLILYPSSMSADNAARLEAMSEISQPICAIPYEDDLAAQNAWSASGFFPLAHPNQTFLNTVKADAQSYFTKNWFGFFGGNPGDYFFWGDVRIPATTGTPRNTLAGSYFGKSAVWAQSPTALEALEMVARAQTLRGMLRGVKPDGKTYVWTGFIHDTSQNMHGIPRGLFYDGFADYSNILGWSYEHMTLDSIYDYYLLSAGDPAIKMEIECMGYQIMCAYTPGYYLDIQTGSSERGEGWMLYSLAMAYKATGKREFLTQANTNIARIKRKIDQMGRLALGQYSDGHGVWTVNHWWSAPWQAAFLSYGLHAWSGVSTDAAYCLDKVLTGLITNGIDWTTGVMKFLYDITNPADYPAGRPLDGVDQFIISAMQIAINRSATLAPDVVAKAQTLKSRLMQQYAVTLLTPKLTDYAASVVPLT